MRRRVLAHGTNRERERERKYSWRRREISTRSNMLSVDFSEGKIKLLYDESVLLHSSRVYYIIHVCVAWIISYMFVVRRGNFYRMNVIESMFSFEPRFISSVLYTLFCLS